MTPLAASLGPTAYWYLARATGAVALALLTISVVLGVLDAVRFSVAPRWPRFAIDALHRDTSLLVIALLVIHVITSVLDGFAPIALIDGVIPFHSPYRPLWLGLGAVSFDLLLALVITSVMRRRLGYRSWRLVHWLAYVSWPIAVLHGVGTGTDAKSWWMLLLTAVCVAAVLIAVLVRVSRTDGIPDRIRAGAGALSLATIAGLAVFTLVGPLQPGWARRAGTPLKLLGVHTAVASTSPSTSTSSSSAKGPLDHRFSANLSGTVSQQASGGGAIVEISLRLGGGAHGQMRIRLGGEPLSTGGLSLTGSQVDVVAPGMPSAMVGKVLSLQGDRFDARVSDSSGAVVELRASLTIDQNTGAVTGTLTGDPVAG